MINNAAYRANGKRWAGWPAILALAVVLPAGCSGQPAEQPRAVESPADEAPVRLLVVDDAPLAAVIRREWAARGTGLLSVRDTKSSELPGLVRLDADAVIYPSGWIGELAERRLIVPVPDEVLASQTLAWEDVFRLLRLKEATWGKQTYAIPLGSPQLVVFYRVDVFAQLNLSPPRTWQDYQLVLEQISAHAVRAGGTATPSEAERSDEPQEGDLDASPSAAAAAGPRIPPFATVEPLAPGWAGQVLLARAACYAQHRSQYSTLFDFTSMQPLIQGPPFVRALEEMVTATKHGPPEPCQVTPAAARRLFQNSDAVMALAWPTHAADSEGVSAETADEADRDGAAMKERDESVLPDGAVGFAALPGSRETYQFLSDKWEERRPDESAQVPLLAVAGRLGSVTRESRCSRRALAVLVWLAGREWSAAIAPASSATTLFRSSHLASPRKWVSPSLDDRAAQAYAKLVEQGQTSPVWLTGLRIPGRGEYLAVLDQAAHRAVRGEQTPAAALTAAAEEWEKITDRLGRDRQRLAYQRSIGIAP